MKQKIRTIFFGSAPDSLPTLNLLNTWISPDFTLELVGVVTQPPRPAGRQKIITPTPVQIWAEQHTIPTLSFPSIPETPWIFLDEEQVVSALSPLAADLIVVTYYGQKIPWAAITAATYGGINVHPSLLPRWRGADPIPWAILTGDHQVGITVLTLAEQFDEGKILGQKKIPLTATDMTNPLYEKLFILGAELLGELLSDYLTGKNAGTPQGASPTPYARRLQRADGFVPWEKLEAAIKDGTEAEQIDRMYRALTPWPGIWTTLLLHGTEKRVKILELQYRSERIHISTVQIEGKTPIPFATFRSTFFT